MDERTERFIDLVIEQGWADRAQADECLRIQETVREVGVEQRIEEIFVKKGYLTQDQVTQASRKLSRMKVGKYQILEKLGEGGAGIVYKANQEPLERKVAIKLLSRRRTASEKYIERFLREARIAVTLNHQNIVRGLDYGEADGYHYYVMEYVEGESLYDIVKREGTISEKRAFDYGLQTVGALKHAARFDLVHRDIKPENILVTSGGVAKLCDLGLAKPSLAETAAASKDGITIGTPTYMSPEQIRGKDEADFRSDIYSLGATIFHLVAGRPPFSGPSSDVVVRKHLKNPVPDPREFTPTLSSGAAAVIIKMLAKKPADRYGSFDDLEEDFHAVLDGRPPRHTIHVGKRSRAPKGPVEVSETGSRRARMEVEKKRGKLVSAIVVAAILVLAAGGFFVVNHLRKKEPVEPETPSRANDGSGTPVREDPDLLAEELYREALDYARENPKSSFDGRIERFELVRRRYPDSRWAIDAKDRIRELTVKRDEALAEHLKEAEEACDDLVEKARGLAAKKRYGVALDVLKGYPDDYADTEFPERLRLEATRIEQEAEQATSAVLDLADLRMKSGRYDEARKTLDELDEVGIPELAAKLSDKRGEVDEAETMEEQARKRSRELFLAEVGGAFVRASTGDYGGAEERLLEAASEEGLVYYQDDLGRAAENIREARRFADAIVDGAKRLVGPGKTKLSLRRGSPAEIEARVLGASLSGIRIVARGGDKVLSYGDLDGVELVRLGFRALDEKQAADHRAAALYLIVHGLLTAADKEIEVVSVLGQDPAPLRERLKEHREYLRGLADDDVRMSEVYLAQEDLPRAMEALRRAVARAPWYARPHLLLGARLVEHEDPDDALAELSRAAELGEEDPELYYYTAEACRLLHRVGDARESFGRYLAAAPEDAEHRAAAEASLSELGEAAMREKVEELIDRARTAYRRDRWDESIKLYGQILELDPKETDALYYRGLAYLELGEVLAGYRELRRYLDVDSEGRRATVTRRKVRELERKHRDSPRCAEFLTLGSAQADVGKYEPAIVLFDKAVNAAPLNSSVYFHRGVAYRRIGERDGDPDAFRTALADFDTVGLLEPERTVRFEEQALCLYYLREMDESLVAAERAIETNPNRWQAYNVAGLVHYSREEWDKAITFYDKGLAKSPDQVILYINKMLALEGADRFDEVLALISEVNKKRPTPDQIKQIQRIWERVKEKQR